MKKIFNIFILVIMIGILSACGSKKVIEEQKDVTIGDTISLEKFDISFVNYSLRKAISSSEKYQDLVFLEVNAKNTTDTAIAVSTSLYTVYGPNNIKLEKISGTKYTSLITKVGNIRANGTTNGHIIFPFIGYGEYYIEWVNKKKTITMKWTIYEEQ